MATDRLVEITGCLATERFRARYAAWVLVVAGDTEAGARGAGSFEIGDAATALLGRLAAESFLHAACAVDAGLAREAGAAVVRGRAFASRVATARMTFAEAQATAIAGTSAGAMRFSTAAVAGFAAVRSGRCATGGWRLAALVAARVAGPVQYETGGLALIAHALLAGGAAGLATTDRGAARVAGKQCAGPADAGLAGRAAPHGSGHTCPVLTGVVLGTAVAVGVARGAIGLWLRDTRPVGGVADAVVTLIARRRAVLRRPRADSAGASIIYCARVAVVAGRTVALGLFPAVAGGGVADAVVARVGLARAVLGRAGDAGAVLARVAHSAGVGVVVAAGAIGFRPLLAGSGGRIADAIVALVGDGVAIRAGAGCADPALAAISDGATVVVGVARVAVGLWPLDAGAIGRPADPVVARIVLRRAVLEGAGTGTVGADIIHGARIAVIAVRAVGLRPLAASAGGGIADTVVARIVQNRAVRERAGGADAALAGVIDRAGVGVGVTSDAVGYGLLDAGPIGGAADAGVARIVLDRAVRRRTGAGAVWLARIAHGAGIAIIATPADIRGLRHAATTGTGAGVTGIVEARAAIAAGAAVAARAQRCLAASLDLTIAISPSGLASQDGAAAIDAAGLGDVWQVERDTDLRGQPGGQAEAGQDIQAKTVLGGCRGLSHCRGPGHESGQTAPEQAKHPTPGHPIGHVPGQFVKATVVHDMSFAEGSPRTAPRPTGSHHTFVERPGRLDR